MLAFISSSLSFSPLAPGLVVPRSTAASSVAAISMDVSPKRNIPSATTDMDEYLKGRDTGRYQGGSNAKASEELKEWAKYDTDFDGGDSGGGVVGDGNTDLEDQHNSASIVRPKLTNPGPRRNPIPIPNPNPNRNADARPKSGPSP